MPGRQCGEAAEQARAALAGHLHRFHQTYDLLLTPTVASAAFTASTGRGAG